jgi:hypothetical protein
LRRQGRDGGFSFPGDEAIGLEGPFKEDIVEGIGGSVEEADDDRCRGGVRGALR